MRLSKKYAALGEAPALLERDDASTDGVAVASYGAWKSRFGADPKIVGKSMKLGRKSMEIVGVACPEFAGPQQERIDLWVSLTLSEELVRNTGIRGPDLYPQAGLFPHLSIIGRLNPGLTREGAETALLIYGRQAYLTWRDWRLRPDIIYVIFSKSENRENFFLLLAAPLILTFFILVGLRFAFSIPADLNSNWIFKIMGKEKLRGTFGGVRKFMLCAILIPLLLIFAPCYFLMWDPRVAIWHIIYVSIISMIFIELLLLRGEKLPFTCSYIPGKSNLKALWPVYLLSCALYCAGTPGLELALLRSIKGRIVFLLIAGILLITLHRFRASFLNKISAIRFEEESDDAVTVLSIEG